MTDFLTETDVKRIQQLDITIGTDCERSLTFIMFARTVQILYMDALNFAKKFIGFGDERMTDIDNVGVYNRIKIMTIWLKT